MRDKWCNQCDTKPVSQLYDTTSSYLKLKNNIRKPWFPWPHHATPKTNTLFLTITPFCEWLLFQLEIHHFNWSQTSHHVKRMMQPARIKTAKTNAIPLFLYTVCSRGFKTIVIPMCFSSADKLRQETQYVLCMFCSWGAKTIVIPCDVARLTNYGKKTSTFYACFAAEAVEPV